MTKRPIRFFNTTDPCKLADHYMAPSGGPPCESATALIYPRQALLGASRAEANRKTTYLQRWMCEINAGNEVGSCYVRVEIAKG